MNLKSTLWVILGAALFLSLPGCNYAEKHIYTSRSFQAVAKQHRTIAILPFDVQVGLRPNEMKKLTEEQLYALELQHGRALQSTLQVFFLNKINRDREVVQVQDVNQTNAILAEKDIQPEDIAAYPPTELAQMLGVDAVMTGAMVTDKPLSNGMALLLSVYMFLYTNEIDNTPPTNYGTAAIKIYDGPSGNLLWSYDKMLTRGLGSGTHTIVRALTRKASKKIPYAKMKV